MLLDVLAAMWCAGWTTVAAHGVWRRSVRPPSGRPASSRTVRVAARVERVETPRESGTTDGSGIPVVVAFQDPATGERLLLPTAGARNGRLDAAWVGREVTVRFPAGHPYDFRVEDPPTGRARRPLLPVAAASLAWAGLTVWLAVRDGGAWALLGFGTLLAALAARGAVANSRTGRRRARLLATAQTATGRIVGSWQFTVHDADGNPHPRHLPVVTFTTADARTVTAVRRPYAATPHPHTLGAEIPVHYVPTDPAILAFDPRADRHAHGCGTALLTALSLAAAAAALTGLALRMRG